MTNKIKFTIIFSFVLLGGLFVTARRAEAFSLADCQSTAPQVNTSMTAGSQYEVRITCVNQFGDPWTQAAGHKIVSISNTNETPNPTPSSNIWGVTEVRMISGNLDNTNNVAVGQTKHFRFNVTAPSTPGSYLFRWHFYEPAGPSYNGYSPVIYVNVAAPVPSPTCSSATPDNETIYTTQGTRRTFVNGVANATSVYLPAWSDYGGQDDIVWYPASVYSGSTWYYDIPTGSRNGTGNISVYAYLNNSGHSNVFCDSANFNLQPPPPTVSLYANGQESISISYNTNITLSWSATNSPSSCTASSSPSSSWSGSQSASGGWNSPNLTTSHTFTLTCSNGGGSGSDSVTVNVAGPPTTTVDLYANGSNGPISVAYNASVTLSWSSSNASSCTASSSPASSWSGSQSLSGGWNSPNLTTSHTFTLSCSGAGSPGSDSVVVNVIPPPTINMEVRGPTGGWSEGPITINFGQSATIRWSSTNSSGGCNVSGNSGASGSFSTGALYSTTTFTGQCFGTGASASDSVTVNINPPPAVVNYINANGQNPLTVAYNTSVTLSWSTSNATSCNASSTPSNTGWTGPQNASGGWNSSALTTTTTFTLSCSSGGGSDSKNVTVNVNPPAAVSVEMYANGSNGPISVAYNTNVTLSWSASNATSCTASSSPSSSWSGGQSLSGGWNSPNLTTTHTFTLSCSGAGASGSDSVTVNVQPPPPSPTCTNATPDNDWTTATSGTRAAFANGVSNANRVYFATFTDAQGPSNALWYPATNTGGGTWRYDIPLASHPGNGTINVHAYLYSNFFSDVWCDSANFTRIGGNGRIEVNANIDTSWTVTCNLTNPPCPTYSGTNAKSGSYDNVPYGTWTITPLNVPGYDVQVQPSNSRTIP